MLVGYLAGVGLIMAAGQLGRLTGVAVSGESFGPQVWSFAHDIGHARAGDTVISVVVIAFLFTVRTRWTWLPGPLVAVLGATAVSALFGLGRHGVALTGAIPGALPAPRIPSVSWHDVRNLVAPAAGILTVSFSEVVLTGRAFEHEVGGTARANAELLALGAAHASAGLLRGFPVSSSVSRTAIASATGARSQVFSLTSLAVVLVALLAARPVLGAIPDAALAGIVIYAAGRLIDIAAFRRLAAFRRSEVVLALAACAGVLGFGILYGVLAAVGLSVAELVRRVSRPHGAILGLVPGIAGMHDIGDYPQAQTVPGLVVYRYDAPLFFANAQDFRRRALAAAARAVPAAGQEGGAAQLAGEQAGELIAAGSGHAVGQARWFVLNAEANIEADYTALEAVEDVRAELVRRGTVFALSHVKAELLEDLRKFGLVAKVGADRIFPTLPTAVAAYRQWAQENPPTRPLPAKFVKPGVADAEVMGDLVDDGAADLVGDFPLGPADRADRLTVDGDVVGQDAGVLGGPAGEGDALVEAEQSGRPAVVLHRHGDVAHQLPEFFRQAVQCLADHLLEAPGINIDHPFIVQRGTAPRAGPPGCLAPLCGGMRPARVSRTRSG